MKDNDFLYSVKLIAALFVITIHAPFWGDFGFGVRAISRFAVPFFFAVSGRFLLVDSKDGSLIVKPLDIRRKVSARLFKLILTTLFVYIIYTIYSLWFHFFITREVSSFSEWINMKYNPFEARVFFLFNSGRFIYDGSYVFDHMWYLFALIYVYVLIWIFAPIFKFVYKKLVIVLIALLFFGEMLQTYYPIRPFGISIKTWYVMRNWLFVGIPFVLLGVWFSDYFLQRKKNLSEENKALLIRHYIALGLGLLISGVVLSVFEMTRFDEKEVYPGSVLIVIGIFFLSECDLGHKGVLSLLGKKASSNIYYFHVLVIALLDMLALKGIINPVSYALKPILVMAICLIVFGVPVIIKDMNN